MQQAWRGNVGGMLGRGEISSGALAKEATRDVLGMEPLPGRRICDDGLTSLLHRGSGQNRRGQGLRVFIPIHKSIATLNL
ncbi:hypothetical protein E2562_030381 [Oryza meyeriana var. granulata]|uniref:Uncharacterized protein n=1 Tax=Oryza meyeriana var. granulata TaxID=110450 RepID=A0A6G1DQ68_9ORYZ|nr:hypothetical protein E2562_030381 [Oryza meyeriana var. granulata]